MVPDTIFFFMVNSSSLNAADDLSILVQIFIAQGVGYCKLWKFVGKMNNSRLKRIFFFDPPPSCLDLICLDLIVEWLVQLFIKFAIAFWNEV